jgi:hypothetical protein
MDGSLKNHATARLSMLRQLLVPLSGDELSLNVIGLKVEALERSAHCRIRT